MKSIGAWWMVGVLALSGCYEHRTLGFVAPGRDGGAPPPPDGGPFDDLDFGLGPDVEFGACGDRTTVHRFDDLRIPTQEEATAGDPVGHDLARRPPPGRRPDPDR